MTTLDQLKRICAHCGEPIAEPYTHCGICAADYCLACGSVHLCNDTCALNGCVPGRCVKVIQDGKPARTWGVPAT